jgi:hypothetical protein
MRGSKAGSDQTGECFGRIAVCRHHGLGAAAPAAGEELQCVA